MNCTVRLQSKRFFPQIAELGKNGKLKRIPVTVSSLFLTDPTPIVGSGVHRISQRKRKGVYWYTISEKPLIPGPAVEVVPGVTRCPKVVDLTAEWVKTDSLTESEVWSWLTARIGIPAAGAVLIALQNALPN